MLHFTIYNKQNRQTPKTNVLNFHLGKTNAVCYALECIYITSETDAKVNILNYHLGKIDVMLHSTIHNKANKQTARLSWEKERVGCVGGGGQGREKGGGRGKRGRFTTRIENWKNCNYTETDLFWAKPVFQLTSIPLIILWVFGCIHLSPKKEHQRV